MVVITAQFNIRLPEGLWVAQVSQEFPSATFRLLSGLRIDEKAVELGEIITNSPESVGEVMREHPSIGSYEKLELSGRRLLVKYETTDTDLYEFVERSALTVEFPIVVQNGWFEFDLTGTREELDTLRTMLDAAGTSYELRSLVSTEESGTLLTDRQREVLETAVRKGYFQVPRECTLAELATALDIDKSTASTVLRRGEARIVQWFITGPEQRAGPR